jgi:hypothetical protein
MYRRYLWHMEELSSWPVQVTQIVKDKNSIVQSRRRAERAAFIGYIWKRIMLVLANRFSTERPW